MALPYASPSSSHPSTPAHLSRPGTPSKSSRSLPPIMSALIQDASNPNVLEKHQHLSASRFPHSSQIPKALRPLSPYFRALALSIPRTSKLLLVPIPKMLLTAQSRHPPPPLTPRRGPDGVYVHHQNMPPPRPSLLGYIVIALLTILAIVRIRNHSPHLNLPFAPSSSNILNQEQIARVWQWEIIRGHYPSSRRLPTTVGLSGILNPGVDANSWNQHESDSVADQPPLARGPRRFPDQFTGVDAIRPSGPRRSYLGIPQYNRSTDIRHLSFPARPREGAVIDLDLVMEHCDFTLGRYVRDCLEILRAGAGLDNLHRLRRGKMDSWKHLFVEDREIVLKEASSTAGDLGLDGQDVMEALGYTQLDPHNLSPAMARDHQTLHGGRQEPQASIIARSLRAPTLALRQNVVGFGPHAAPHPTHPTADPVCDPDYPKIFHIFWAGPFTDKPYLAVMSFLFTQNLGLQYRSDTPEKDDFLSRVCRPQLWVWINPGPAASLPNPSARQQMYDGLRQNPWSAPFLHERFGEAVKFKLWNTTEQLDNIPELKTHWRSLPLFNSGGVKYGSQTAHEPEKEEQYRQETESPSVLSSSGGIHDVEEEHHGRFGEEAAGTGGEYLDKALQVKGAGLNDTAVLATGKSTPATRPKGAKRKKSKDELLNRIGSSSSKDYDRLTVVLSDMARFVLTHRFGGIYLDADTIFLRDWEELWNWKGAFAYRWSRLEKYNTAVLKMHRNSAIGSFLFKSALANGLDFHPMTISRYTKDASLEGLLLRLPDALFDSAWLNTEYYQRDRPAYPYFKRFEDFFDPPKEDSAAPAAVGFESFYRGAYSYHFHNFWWIAFDPSRNWPDLGSRFVDGERKARAAAMKARLAAEQNADTQSQENTHSRSPTRPPGEADTPRTKAAQDVLQRTAHRTDQYVNVEDIRIDQDDVRDDARDLSWATVLKRTFEQYLREERPNMYGEWLRY